MKKGKAAYARNRIGVLSIACVLLSLSAAGQQVPCNPPFYTPRSTSQPKLMSWDLAGSYIVEGQSGHDGSLAADMNGDGRKELIRPNGIGGWETLEFISPTRGYEVTQSKRSPHPFNQFSTTAAVATFAIGRLEVNGPLKLFAGGDLQIYDLASKKLELVSHIEPGLFRVWLKDLDGDGRNEIVGSGGVVLDPDLTRYISRAQSEGYEHLANYDADTNLEMVSTFGSLVEWRNGRWVDDQRIAIDSSQQDAIAATGDLDGDGANEFVYVANGRFMHVHSFRQRRSLWSTEVKTVQTDFKLSAGVPPNWVSSIEITDVSGDGVRDVIVITVGEPDDEGEIQAFDGRNGQKLWSFTHPEVTANDLHIDEFDGVPGREIMFAAGTPCCPAVARTFVHDLATRQLTWVQRQESGPVSAMALGDFTAAAGREVIVAPTNIPLESDTRIYVRGFDSMQSLVKLDSALLPEPMLRGLQALAFGDVTGNADPELIVGADDWSSNSRVYVYSWPGRVLLRSFTFGPRNAVADLAIADTDGNGNLEVIAVTGKQALPQVFVLDIRTNTIVWNSPELFASYGTVHALKIADLNGDNRPEIVVTGANVIIIDGATRSITRLSEGSHFGLEIGDVTGDNLPDIIVGQSSGPGGFPGIKAIVAFANPSWSKVNEIPVPYACPWIHALAWNSFEPTKKQLFFTCESQVGVVDLSTRELRLVSTPIDIDVGLQNHLFAVRTSSGQPRLLVGALLGAHSLAPTNNLVPFVSPTNACQPNRFFKHWRANFAGALPFFDIDGDPLTTQLIRPPLLSNLTTDFSTSAARFYFGVMPYRGEDLWTTTVSDGLDTSPRAVSSIFVSNTTPSILDRTESVTAGSMFLGVLPTRDWDDDVLTYQVLQAPTHGTLTLQSSGFTYVPTPGFTGADAFQIRGFDQVDYSTPANYTMQVQGAPAAPPSQPPAQPPATPAESSGGGGQVNELLLLCMLALFSLRTFTQLSPLRSMRRF